MSFSSRFWNRLARAIAYSIVGALRSSKRKHAPRKTKATARVQQTISDEEFIRKMREIAATSDGTVQVLIPSGRRTRPNELVITNLDDPGHSHFGKTFISAKAVIDGIHYTFHAYPHPTATAYSKDWIYFSVTGPARDVGSRETEFLITDDFHWTGERPLNPILVKFALREWMRRLDTQAAIEAARRKLPVPPPRARMDDPNHS
jgi:hypothetical protein